MLIAEKKLTGNEIIAQYAGWTKEGNRWKVPYETYTPGEEGYDSFPGNTIKASDLPFDRSYDAIMAVKDMIERKGFTFHMEKSNVWMSIDKYDRHDPRYTIPPGSTHPDLKQALFETILQFRDWELRQKDIRR